MRKLLLLILFSVTIIGNSCAPVYRLAKFSPSLRLTEVAFNNEVPNQKYEFIYPDSSGNEFLRKLRINYQIDTLYEAKADDLTKILAITNWTHNQWEHSGSNTPSEADALTILKEAREGKSFRCVEYGIVASSAFKSIGMPARPLSLKTRDVEKVRYGAGHVVSEVFSAALNKWIFVDPQFNTVPTLNDQPLNAVEFKEAIFSHNDELKIVNANGVLPADEARNYVNWVAKYLYFFDVCFDQREGEFGKMRTVEGKTKLMLVPLGEKNPTVFQRKYPIDYCCYTRSLNDFYRAPL